MSFPVPPFQITCAFHEGAHTDEEAFAGWKPTENDWLYLSVTTPINKWQCRVKRGEMAKLFEAINANLPSALRLRSHRRNGMTRYLFENSSRR